MKNKVIAAMLIILVVTSIALAVKWSHEAKQRKAQTEQVK
jgi:preprotein translocase subunit SecG